MSGAGGCPVSERHGPIPFYKRAIHGFIFHLRLEELGPAELVTQCCGVCEYRKVVSPWQLLSRHIPAARAQSSLNGVCPRCKAATLLFGVVTATSDLRDVPSAQGGTGPPAPPLRGAP